MVAFTAIDGSILEFHPEIIEAVRHHAKLEADLAANMISQIEILGAENGLSFSCKGFPPGFLLELGAIGHLRLWEIQDVHRHLPEDLPSAAEATADLHRRLAADPLAFNSCESAVLSRRLLRVTLEHLSWDAKNFLGCSVAISDIDENALIDTMATILWSLRRQ